MSGDGPEALDQRLLLQKVRAQVVGVPGPAIEMDRLRVLRRLGRGGMGVVFEALDLDRDRRVAVKLMAAPRDGWTAEAKPLGATVSALSEHRQRARALAFEREYQWLVELRHPRIIEVYDYGIGDFGPYYTMEWLDGQDLSSLSPMGFEQACAALRDLASSLAILHARRLVHRDVSPRNARLTSGGRTKLLDFGTLVPMGQPSEIAGTPACIAPEIVCGRPIDARTDLYSLGAVAYRLLTGREAYPARRIEMLDELWSRPPPPPSQLEPDLPRQLDELVLSLLSPEPTGRPSSAGEVAERLCGLAGLPLDEESAVGAAYLTNPSLVAREGALSQARSVLHDTRSCGRLLVVEGEAGVGRSRMLAELAVEAKLAGTAVLAANASDTVLGPFGVAHGLAEQLLRAPGPGLSPYPDVEADASTALQALVSWWSAALRDRRVMLLVDDAHLVDTASLELLAALTELPSGGGALVLSMPSRQDLTSDALRSRCSSAPCLRLGALDLTQTERLLASIFGEVPNLRQRERAGGGDPG